MPIRARSGDNLTTYDVGVPVLLWRPSMRRAPEGGLYSVADGSERFLRVPVLGKLGWLGLVAYMLATALIALLLGVVLVLEWVVAIVVSFVVLASKVVGRSRFLVRADLVGYIGAHKPQGGFVVVGPPDRPISRPVRVEWSRPTLSAARDARRTMADHIEASQFADVNA